MVLTADRKVAREQHLNSVYMVATRHSEEKGMHLVALKDFEPGDVILESAPVAFVLGEDGEGSRCYECFCRMSGGAELLRCSACRAARYCGKQCQTAAWASHHRLECCIQEGVHQACSSLPPVAQQELRLLLRVALLAACGSSSSTPPLQQTPNKDCEGYTADFSDVANMPANSDHMRRTDRSRCMGNTVLASMASNLLGCAALRKKKGFDAKRIPSEAELIRMLERFAFNDFAMWDELLVNVGSGVYPLGAILNHSCAPNCVLYYEPRTHKQCIRTVRAVACGEELCHSYIDQAATTAERQDKLQHSYGFKCSCARCLDVGGSRDQALRSAVPVDHKDRKYVEGMKILSEGGTREQLARGCALLKEVLSMWREGRHIADLSLMSLRSSLLQGLLESGHAKEAALVCAEQVEAYRFVYDSFHPLLGLQLYTLGNLLVEEHSKEDVQAGLGILREARCILVVTHGVDSQMVKGLDDLAESVQKQIIL